MTKQTKWEEIFDSRFFNPSIPSPSELRTFIHQNRKELVEEILADIPDEFEGKIYALPKRLKNLWDLKPIKQQLRDKYLNN